MVTKGLPGGRCQHNLSYALPRRAMLEFRAPSLPPLAILCPLRTWAPRGVGSRYASDFTLWLMYASRNCIGWGIKTCGLFCMM